MLGNVLKYSGSSNGKPLLGFYSFTDEASGLSVDCVTGVNVQHNFPLHIHDSLCIGLVTYGKRELLFPGTVEEINTGDLFIVNKNQPHAIRQHHPHNYIALTVNGIPGNPYYVNKISSAECTALFLDVFWAIEHNSVTLLAEKWTLLFTHLNKHYTSRPCGSGNNNFIVKSLGYIKQHYNEPLKVEDIARHVAMSKYHFSRQFKQATGLSPHNYLVQYRLKQSRSKLKNHLPVFDTAVDTGFYDSSHFIRLFYDNMAISPKDYQHALQKE